MDIASKTEAGKPLMKFAQHSSSSVQPDFLIVSQRHTTLLCMVCVILFAFLSLQTSYVFSAPANDVQTKQERKAAKAERKRQKQLERKAKKLARKKQKQIKQQRKQKRIQHKSDKTVITLNKNTKIKIKPKGDTTKVVVVKKKNSSHNLSHTSTIEQITELVSTGADARTIRKTVDSITPDKYPRHAPTGPKTIIQFDDSGLIGFKMKNQQATLKQPLNKSSVIKQAEAKYGELQKIKVKNTHKKTKVVSVFKKTAVSQPVNQPPVNQPEVTVPVTVTNPVVNQPVNNNPIVVEQPVQVTTPAPATPNPVVEVTPVVNTPAPITTETPGSNQQNPLQQAPTQVVNAPVINTPPAPTVPTPSVPTVPSVTIPDTVIQTPTTVVNTPAQQPVVTVSITRRIEGAPQGSGVSQPLTVLNLGGAPTSANNPPPAGPSPQFNARIADTGESLDTENNTESTLGDMPVHKISYLDTTGYRKQNTLFSTTGTGISLNVDQCEELEACAPAVAKRNDRATQKLRAVEATQDTVALPNENNVVNLPEYTSQPAVQAEESEDAPIDLSLFADANQTIEDDE